MKTRTNLHAGSAPTRAQMLKCLNDQSDLNQKISELENMLYAPVPAANTTQPVYPAASGNYGYYADMSGYCG